MRLVFFCFDMQRLEAKPWSNRTRCLAVQKVLSNIQGFPRRILFFGKERRFRNDTFPRGNARYVFHISTALQGVWSDWAEKVRSIHGEHFPLKLRAALMAGSCCSAIYTQ